MIITKLSFGELPINFETNSQFVKYTNVIETSSNYQTATIHFGLIRPSKGRNVFEYVTIFFTRI